MAYMYNWTKIKWKVFEYLVRLFGFQIYGEENSKDGHLIHLKRKY